MPFHDNQFFYAALYTTESLPGAVAFTDDICKKYGKPYMPTNAPQPFSMAKTFSEFVKGLPESERSRYPVPADTGVTREQCEIFFDALYASLKEQMWVRPADNFAMGKYVRLDIHNDGTISKVLECAGIPQHDFPPNAQVTMNDNGMLFTHDGDAVTEMMYAARPAMECPCVSAMAEEAFRQAPMLSFQKFYRIIEVREGQEFWTKSHSPIEGENGPFKEKVRGDNNVVVACHEDVPDLFILSDEEILNGGYSLSQVPRRDFAAGRVLDNGCRFEATEHKGIVKYLTTPSPMVHVVEKILLNYGSKLEIAETGDMVYKASPWLHVIKKEDLASGRVQLVQDVPAHAVPQQKFVLK